MNVVLFVDIVGISVFTKYLSSSLSETMRGKGLIQQYYKDS